MTNAKSFTITFFGVVVGFIVYHSLMWHFYTSIILDTPKPFYAGDLARTGYQFESLQLRQGTYTLPKKHIEAQNWDLNDVDLITIGDSCSNAGGGGTNPFYQDYIATYHDLKVLNIQEISSELNYIETIMAWYHTGLLDKAQPKVILIEAIERSALERFARPINWNPTITLEDLTYNIKHKRFNDEAPTLQKPHFINTANYKVPLYNLYYRFSPDAFGYSSVYKHKLTESLFTADATDTLLFYRQDVSNIALQNANNFALMNDNFNQLASILRDKGIKLYVMIVPDKYDMYQDYIVDNPHPKNEFFNNFRALAKQYHFIDTKTILSELLKTGEKDIYFADDTHWSEKASEAIIQNIQF